MSKTRIVITHGEHGDEGFFDAMEQRLSGLQAVNDEGKEIGLIILSEPRGLFTVLGGVAPVSLIVQEISSGRVYAAVYSSIYPLDGLEIIGSKKECRKWLLDEAGGATCSG